MIYPYRLLHCLLHCLLWIAQPITANQANVKSWKSPQSSHLTNLLDLETLDNLVRGHSTDTCNTNIANNGTPDWDDWNLTWTQTFHQIFVSNKCTVRRHNSLANWFYTDCKKTTKKATNIEAQCLTHFMRLNLFKINSTNSVLGPHQLARIYWILLYFSTVWVLFGHLDKINEIGKNCI